jgi:hypothetical protein
MEFEKAARAQGVRWNVGPNKKTTSSERKLLQHQRWFRRERSGEPGQRVESAYSTDDTGCDVASILGWTACAVGWGSASLPTISSR